MAGLRKGIAYRKVVRPYTRKSKFKAKSYIKAVPLSKIVKFDMGNPQKKYDMKISLVSKQNIQIRHNALESARIIVNRKLNKSLGTDYFFKVRPYPHHVLRENKMLTGAGADRMQSGMQQAFGKPVGLAAQVKVGQPIFTAYVNRESVNHAKTALMSATPRMPGKFKVVIES